MLVSSSTEMPKLGASAAPAFCPSAALGMSSAPALGTSLCAMRSNRASHAWVSRPTHSLCNSLPGLCVILTVFSQLPRANFT